MDDDEQRFGFTFASVAHRVIDIRHVTRGIRGFQALDHAIDLDVAAEQNSTPAAAAEQLALARIDAAKSGLVSA